LGARSSLAWADTLAGFAICGSGLALPHGIAMAVVGICANVSHGLALASVYRACLKFIGASAVSAFARLAHLLEPGLDGVSASDAAERCPNLLQSFLGRLRLDCSLRGLGVAKEELPALVKRSMILPHYKNNPKVPTQIEMLEIIAESY
jgi:alcohol dehydrogenase class IV